MNGLITQLINELKDNKSINSSVSIQMMAESINNSLLLGVAPSVILENSLTTLDKLATETVNENIKEVVAKFKKLANTPTKRLANMAKEAGLSTKIKALKESGIASDSVANATLNKIEEALTLHPEFKVIGFFCESLSKFAYDQSVSEAITSVSDYVDQNRIKLEILNSVFEMRRVNSILYNNPCSILEQSLLDDEATADTLRVRLGNHSALPIVSSLLNSISMFEASQSNRFNLGIGNGDATVTPVICPFYKVSESEALIFVDNKFVKVSESEDPTEVSEELALQFKAFYETCKSVYVLGFKQSGSEYSAKGRNLGIAFGLNENGTLHLKINGKKVEDIHKVKFNEIFLMESIENRQLLTQIFDNLDIIVNLEFAKNIVNERLGRDSMVFNFGENVFVFERLGNKRVTKKMKDTDFFDYVLENFNYDVSGLYSIQLSERDENIKSLNTEKTSIQSSIDKLQESSDKIQIALDDSSISKENHEKLYELKRSIEKNINNLKNQYILIDQAKKKA